MNMASITLSPSFSSADSGYWEEIDRISEMYREAIQNEERYICENVFYVTHSNYKIITGLSAARGYVPAVRMLINVPQVFTKPDNISFIREDWNDFITYLRQFIADYFGAVEESEEEKEVQFSNYRLIKSSFIGNKVLKVTDGSCTFSLSGNTVREFINIDKLVSPHMDLLHSLSFENFYNNFLNVTDNILSESNYELPPCTVLLNLSDLYPCNIQTYCMRECLFYNRDKVLNDLDKKCLY